MHTEPRAAEGGLPANRFIPEVVKKEDSKPGQLRPSPLFEVATRISQPDDIYSTYLGRFSGQLRLI